MKQLALLCILSIILVSPTEATLKVPGEMEIENNCQNELVKPNQAKVNLDKAGQINAEFTERYQNEQRHMIPDEAIRLRILAHSDDAHDQTIKNIVRDRVNDHIHLTVADIDKIETARAAIKATIPTLQELIADTLAEHDEHYPFHVTFQQDVPFPLKIYGPYVYPAGDYEAILITLGDGVGENWWCVLFPPLCFVDFFNTATLVEADEEEANDRNEINEAEQNDPEQANETEDVEIRFFLFDLFKTS